MTSWSFAGPLVQVATLPHVRMLQQAAGPNTQVVLVTQEKATYPMTEAERSEAHQTLREQHITWLPLDYKPFGAGAALRWAKDFAVLVHACRKHNVEVIHAFGTPIGFIGEPLSKLLRIPLVLDSYEPHAEVMVENGTWPRNGRAFKWLFASEKRQAHHATAALATTAAMEDYAKRTFGAAPSLLVPRPAPVDLERFHPDTSVHPDLAAWKGDHTLAVYAGKLGGIYWKEEVFALMATSMQHWPGGLKWALLTDLPEHEVHALASEAGVHLDHLWIHHASPDEMPALLAAADFALNPKAPVPSQRYSTSIKDAEYWASGLPVMIPPGISDDSELIATHRAGVVIEGVDFRGACRAMAQLLAEDGPGAKTRARQLAEDHRSLAASQLAYNKVYGPLGPLRT